MTFFEIGHLRAFELRMLAYAEFHRLRRLDTFGGSSGRLVLNPPTLEVKICAQVPGWVGEASRLNNTVCIYIDSNTEVAEMRQTILHELTHLSWHDCWNHYAPFKRVMAQGAFEAWGVDCREMAKKPCKTEDLDDAITLALSTRRNRFAAWTAQISATCTEMAAMPVGATVPAIQPRVQTRQLPDSGPPTFWQHLKRSRR